MGFDKTEQYIGVFGMGLIAFIAGTCLFKNTGEQLCAAAVLTALPLAIYCLSKLALAMQLKHLFMFTADKVHLTGAEARLVGTMQPLQLTMAGVWKDINVSSRNMLAAVLLADVLAFAAHLSIIPHC